MASVKDRLKDLSSLGLTREKSNELQTLTGGLQVAERPQSRGVKSFRYLKALSNDQLIDELIMVHVESTLTKWRIIWELRQRFPSNIEFGNYINDLRKKGVHGLSVVGQQEINRFANCGRFCEKHKINDLSEIKLTPTVISELARPDNDDISDELYQEFLEEVEKGNTIRVKDAKLRIKQMKAVLTVDSLTLDQNQDKNKTSVQNSDIGSKLDDRLIALAEEDASMLTDESAVKEFLIFAKRFRRQNVELIKIFKDCIESIENSCIHK